MNESQHTNEANWTYPILSLHFVLNTSKPIHMIHESGPSLSPCGPRSTQKTNTEPILRHQQIGPMTIGYAGF
jgi:hypothetical protein